MIHNKKVHQPCASSWCLPLVWLHQRRRRRRVVVVGSGRLEEVMRRGERASWLEYGWQSWDEIGCETLHPINKTDGFHNTACLHGVFDTGSLWFAYTINRCTNGMKKPKHVLPITYIIDWFQVIHQLHGGGCGSEVHRQGARLLQLQC